jgi:hypothetical protein
MDGKELLLDLLHHYSAGMHRTLDGLPPDILKWQPDPQANNIALTVWHVSRALDVLKVFILQDQPPENELWFTCGWAEKTGYNPLGLGDCGFGNLAGYTLAEAAAVPVLPLEDLLAYFDQACGALSVHLADLPNEAIDRPVEFAGGTAIPAYIFMRNFLMDAREHLGEIKAIKAMWQRRCGST